jgi:hypothetical protein
MNLRYGKDRKRRSSHSGVLGGSENDRWLRGLLRMVVTMTMESSMSLSMSARMRRVIHYMRVNASLLGNGRCMSQWRGVALLLVKICTA